MTLALIHSQSSVVETSFLAGLAHGTEVAKYTRKPSIRSGTPLNQTSDLSPNKIDSPNIESSSNHPLDHWLTVIEGKFDSESARRIARFYGIYSVPESDLYDCRTKIVGASLRASQLRGLATIADRMGGGCIEFTHHSEVRIRNVRKDKMGFVLEQFIELGLHPLGAGGEGCRGVVCNPLSGLDRSEVADVRPLTKRLHHLLQHQRESFCLPSKFRIGIDGGGLLPLSLERYDLALSAITSTTSNSNQLSFSLRLGGARSLHKTAQVTPICLSEVQVLPVVLEIIRCYAKCGDRIHPDRSRFGFLLDELGIDTFLDIALRRLGGPWKPYALQPTVPHRPTGKRPASNGIEQKQRELFAMPIEPRQGVLSAAQCFSLANATEKFGTAELRLGPNRQLFLVGIGAENRVAVREMLQVMKLSTQDCRKC